MMLAPVTCAVNFGQTVTIAVSGAPAGSMVLVAAPAGTTLPTIPSMTLQCQSVAIGFPSFTGGGLGGGTLPTLTFCTSNVASLQVF
ncbi:MAG: hypothetical protein EXS14_07770 [Planctomycetes bacterium]|nr:hypothetical protein [Planctomycetota bacterium]